MKQLNAIAGTSQLLFSEVQCIIEGTESEFLCWKVRLLYGALIIDKISLEHQRYALLDVVAINIANRIV